MLFQLLESRVLYAGVVLIQATQVSSNMTRIYDRKGNRYSSILRRGQEP